MVQQLRKLTLGDSSSPTQKSINPLGEMGWWGKISHHAVHYAHRQRITRESGGRQKMRKGTRKVYRIVVRSELSDRYAVAFEGMQMDTKDGHTILTGEIIDQPHLFGILGRICGLGLELLSVEALPEYDYQSAEGNREPEDPEL